MIEERVCGADLAEGFGEIAKDGDMADQVADRLKVSDASRWPGAKPAAHARSRRRRAWLILSSSLMVLAAAASGQSVAANDSPVIGEPPPSPSQDGVVGDPELSTERGSACPDMPLLGISDGPRARQAPAIEARPLGPKPELSKADGRTNAQKTEAPSTMMSSGGEIIRVAGALAVVIGLLLILRAVLRRAGGALSGRDRPSGIVEVLARYPIARGQQLVLLKLARRIILLHAGGSSMRALCEINDADEVASLLSRLEAGSTERSAAKFRAALNEFMVEPEGVRTSIRSARSRGRTALPPGDAEIIDLTRRRSLLHGWNAGRAAR